ncbi:MAG: sugar phosphate isomerase/epimerase family protein [Planctomycetaceae bacterium]
MTNSISRRKWLASSGLAAVGTGLAIGGVSSRTEAQTANKSGHSFRYCLNTSTIRGHELDLAAEVELAAKAGYDGIEPWIREFEQFQQKGGSLKDLAARIRDSGLTVESAIGFSNWIVDDDAKRKAALEQAKREMEMVRIVGGTRIAAPPAGATEQTNLNLFAAAQRYAALLDVGEEMGVVPQLEVWGFSKSLSRLGEAVFVAMESGHANACLLPDVYHLYKGGSALSGLKMLSADAIHCLHVNDYPADPPRETITDAHRVYPGDGVAPLDDLFRTLRDIGYHGALSLELFNRDYWKQDVSLVLKTGLEKTKAAVAKALA